MYKDKKRDIDIFNVVVIQKNNPSYKYSKYDFQPR